MSQWSETDRQTEVADEQVFFFGSFLIMDLFYLSIQGVGAVVSAAAGGAAAAAAGGVEAGAAVSTLTSFFSELIINY